MGHLQSKNGKMCFLCVNNVQQRYSVSGLYSVYSDYFVISPVFCSFQRVNAGRVQKVCKLRDVAHPVFRDYSRYFALLSNFFWTFLYSSNFRRHFDDRLFTPAGRVGSSQRLRQDPIQAGKR